MQVGVNATIRQPISNWDHLYVPMCIYVCSSGLWRSSSNRKCMRGLGHTACNNSACWMSVIVTLVPKCEYGVIPTKPYWASLKLRWLPGAYIATSILVRPLKDASDRCYVQSGYLLCDSVNGNWQWIRVWVQFVREFFFIYWLLRVDVASSFRGNTTPPWPEGNIAITTPIERGTKIICTNNNA